MTTQETESLRSEIKNIIDVKGCNFFLISWIENLSDESKSTLNEYFMDAGTLSKRDICILLYSNRDKKIWKEIKANCY